MTDSTKFDDLLADALLRVGCCEGVISSNGEEDEVAIKGKHIDDYLLVTLLGQMIKNKECEFRISPSRLDYFSKLLHIDN